MVARNALDPQKIRGEVPCEIVLHHIVLTRAFDPGLEFRPVADFIVLRMRDVHHVASQVLEDVADDRTVDHIVFQIDRYHVVALQESAPLDAQRVAVPDVNRCPRQILVGEIGCVMVAIGAELVEDRRTLRPDEPF